MLSSGEPLDMDFIKKYLSIEQIMEAADRKLFTAIQHPVSCLT